eukprot:c5960_g1_i1 orf=460-762(-)
MGCDMLCLVNYLEDSHAHGGSVPRGHLNPPVDFCVKNWFIAISSIRIWNLVTFVLLVGHKQDVTFVGERFFVLKDIDCKAPFTVGGSHALKRVWGWCGIV